MRTKTPKNQERTTQDQEKLDDIIGKVKAKNNDEEKSDIVKEWLAYPENNLDVLGLQQVLKLFKQESLVSGTPASVVIRSWVEKSNYTIDELESIVGGQFFFAPNYVVNILQSWMEKSDNITFDTLKTKIFPLVDKIGKEYVVESWLKKNNYKVEIAALEEVMPLLIWKKTESITNWCLNNKFDDDILRDKLVPFLHTSEQVSIIKQLRPWEMVTSYEILKKTLSFVKADSGKVGIILSWVQKGNNISYKTLTEDILPLGKDNRKGVLINHWLTKTEPENNFTYDDLKNKILPSVDSEFRGMISESWLEKNNYKVEIAHFEEIVPLLNLYSKLDFISLWCDNNNFSFDILRDKIIPLMEGYNKLAVIRGYIEKSKVDYETLKAKILPLVIDNYEKSNLIAAWLEVPSNNVTYKTLIEDTLLQFSDSEKALIIVSWLAKPEPENNFTYDDLKNKLLPSVDLESKGIIIEKWFAKPENNIPFEILKSDLLPLAAASSTNGLFLGDGHRMFEGLNYESRVIQKWVAKPENIVSFEMLKDEILPLLGGSNRGEVIIAWIKKEPDEEIRYKKILDAVNADALGDKYDFQAIEKVCRKEEILPKAKMPNLCRYLYPGMEDMQADLFNLFIQHGKLKKEDIGIIKAFTNTLVQNNIVLSVLQMMQEHRGLSEADILDIAGDRLHSKYSTIEKLLKGKTLHDSLTEEGFATLKEFFGEEKAASITLVGLFSYYDITKNMSGFTALVKPEVLEQIKVNFVPTDKVPFIQEAEHEKLQVLTGVDLPPMAKVSTYLKGKTPAVPQLDERAIENYQVNFKNCTSVAPEKQAEFQEKFKALLKDKEPSEDNVYDLFSQFYKTAMKRGHVIHEDNAGEKQKLRDFFEANKNELAALFASEGGVDKFAFCIKSLGDGCVANIATQTRDALYSTLIKDLADKKLYSCFSNKVVTPLFNSGGDHLGGSAEGADVFNNRLINSSFISPTGFVKALEKEFYDDEQKISDPWNFLAEKLGNEKQGAIYGILDPEYMGTPTIQQEGSEIATYVILKSAIPALLDNKFSQQFKVKCEGVLKQANETVEKQNAFDNVAEAILIAAQKNTFIYQPTDACEKQSEKSSGRIMMEGSSLSSALSEAYGGNLAKLQEHIPDPMAKPDSQVMQTNNTVKELGKKLITENAKTFTVGKILSDFVNNTGQPSR